MARASPELPKPTQPLQQISADSLIIARQDKDEHRKSLDEHTTDLVIRDAFSGQSTTTPMQHRTKDAVYLALKRFVGVAAAKKLPTLIVKSDAAPEIVKAVEELGWLSEPSL